VVGDGLWPGRLSGPWSVPGSVPGSEVSATVNFLIADVPLGVAKSDFHRCPGPATVILVREDAASFFHHRSSYPIYCGRRSSFRPPDLDLDPVVTQLVQSFPQSLSASSRVWVSGGGDGDLTGAVEDILMSLKVTESERSDSSPPGAFSWISILYITSREALVSNRRYWGVFVLLGSSPTAG